jgi:hypothetical protein
LVHPKASEITELYQPVHRATLSIVYPYIASPCLDSVFFFFLLSIISLVIF